jgi:Trk-type K+ transport system membrane component
MSPIKRNFDFSDKFQVFYKLALWINILGLILLIIDAGFNQSRGIQQTINITYFAVVITGVLATILRYLTHLKILTFKVLVFDLSSVLLSLYIVFIYFTDSNFFAGKGETLYHFNWVKLVVLITFIRELAAQNINYKKIALNPAQLFIFSFIAIILLCSILLMLPNATTSPIQYIDALFTATSAVCVTGLAVVDTGTQFTFLGQSIIVIFIQLGGLGILTFASYFSYFFKGGSTYSNHLVMSDMTNSEKIGEVFSTFKRILIITFSIELIGALLIYSSLKNSLIPTFSGKVFFSVFHSISAFCNAGFSTLSNSLFQSGYQYNYFLQLNIVFLFVLGGLGFPIVINLIKYLKYFITKNFTFIAFGRKAHKPWMINLNSRITLITTGLLILFGTSIYFILEYNNTLSNHGVFGKIVTSLFQATTPRTAGFNSVDMSLLNTSTTLIIILLMWIGASPSSTGGGIKTSTFAIGILNFISLSKGKEKIEVYRREISQITIRRAFAIITLSLFVVGIGILLISNFNPELNLLSIVFECFSAYSTAGLSLGITSSLENSSKMVVIFMMFLGRVSMLTLLIAFMRKSKYKHYSYPKEDILIN